MFEPTKAPFIRPGVLIHERSAQVDDLLAEFALTLRRRGFTVAGCLRHGGEFTCDSDAIGGTDLMRKAAATFRAAMRDDADLVVIGSFPAFAAAARQLQVTVQAGGDGAMPVLTAIPGADVQQWLDFSGPGAAMLSPDMKSLWQWWGAERLYRDLTLGVGADEVRQIVCGPRWVMVQGPAGVGLAYLPRSSKELVAQLPRLKRLSLRQLAELSASWDPLEMAVGIAAINAHYNRFDLHGDMGNGAETFGEETGRVVVIGAFPGLADTLANPQVIETEPRPGEYPTVAMDTLLPGCAATVVASSTIINRTLPRILRLAQGARVAVIGPVTPMTPRLFDYGIEVLGGLVVRDAEGLAAAIRAGALPREFARFGQYVHIRRSEPEVGLRAAVAGN